MRTGGREKIIKHGSSRRGSVTKVYKVWLAMRDRCNNPNNRAYENYGGRGIKVCVRWHDYANFLKDMGERPLGASIERRDNAKGYNPDNCYWATREEQNSNRRSVLHVTYNGETRTAAQWDRFIGFSRSTTANRLKMGWSIERTLTTPKKRHAPQANHTSPVQAPD